MSRDDFEEVLGAMARAELLAFADAVFEKQGKRIPYRTVSLLPAGLNFSETQTAPFIMRDAVAAVASPKRGKKGTGAAKEVKAAAQPAAAKHLTAGKPTALKSAPAEKAEQKPGLKVAGKVSAANAVRAEKPAAPAAKTKPLPAPTAKKPATTPVPAKSAKPVSAPKPVAKKAASKAPAKPPAKVVAKVKSKPPAKPAPTKAVPAKKKPAPAAKATKPAPKKPAPKGAKKR
jgi:hypothetical protein